MKNIAIDYVFEMLQSYDTAAAGDGGIIREHVAQLFEDLNIDPNMSFTDFQNRLTAIGYLT